MLTEIKYIIEDNMKFRFRNYLFIFFTLIFTTTAFAEEQFSREAMKNDNMQLPYYNKYYDQETSYDSKVDAKKMTKISEGPLKKLGRGVSNLIFGPFEILIQPYEVNKEEGGISALTYGVFKGVYYFLTRAVVGVVEIVTFPFPLPGASPSGFKDEWGYGPLIQPEWVFDLDRNPYNFIYHDDPL
jgi:putative exosortase-associated protein (TIGR04073 family)